MILTVVRISLLRLWHNRAELLLTFVVPLIFFSIFAWIFGSRDSDGGTPRIKVALADLSNTDQSKEIAEKLFESRTLRFFGNTVIENESQTYPVLRSEKQAIDWVRHGRVTAAIVLRPTSVENEPEAAVTVKLGSGQVQAEILADSFDKVATQILGALVQKAVLTSEQKIAQEAATRARQNSASLAHYQQPGDAANVIGEAPMSEVQQAGTAMAVEQVMELPEIQVRDVMGENKTNPVIAMYAAGIAVMFSLFSTTTASGSLLEERENSTLERLLCSRLSIDQLLMGKWLFLTCLGITQISLMFLWGWFAFGVELFSHIPGFAVMTVVTSAAAASFALMLATLCRTRIQLGWVSTILILVMSALGGSMVPRYLMSESVQRVGMFTFNAWALEGYNKVFWRELDLRAINTELAVLLTSAFAMLVAARLFAIRWERS